MKTEHKELYILTLITVWAAGIDLGKILNTIIALTIASVKASLVALFFMHLKYESKLLWFMILIPLFLLLILFALPILDVITRAGYFLGSLALTCLRKQGGLSLGIIGVGSFWSKVF